MYSANSSSIVVQITRSRGAVGKLLNYGVGEPVLEPSSRPARTSFFFVFFFLSLFGLFAAYLLLVLPLHICEHNDARFIRLT